MEEQNSVLLIYDETGKIYAMEYHPTVLPVSLNYKVCDLKPGEYVMSAELDQDFNPVIGFNPINYNIEMYGDPNGPQVKEE